MFHRHIDRVRQYYEDYYAQHEGEENVPPPPPPPREDLAQRRGERVRELLGGLDVVHGDLMEALRNIIHGPAALSDSDSSSSTDEAA